MIEVAFGMQYGFGSAAIAFAPGTLFLNLYVDVAVTLS